MDCSSKNLLRSIVNRVCNDILANLAGNPNNFEPREATHLMLLDSCRFRKTRWKFKRLHKLIMLSDTYRLSTSHPDGKLRNEDPEKLQPIVFRRLTVRTGDGMLVSTVNSTVRSAACP